MPAHKRNIYPGRRVCVLRVPVASVASLDSLKLLLKAVHSNVKMVICCDNISARNKYSTEKLFGSIGARIATDEKILPNTKLLKGILSVQKHTCT